MNTRQATQTTRPAQDAQPTAGKAKPSGELVEAIRHYASERPETVALWCLGIGFVLGWKLKIW